MFFLNSLQPGSFRRHCARNVFALCILVCLSAALLFTGCTMDDGGGTGGAGAVVEVDSRLIGTWEYETIFEGVRYEEKYVITATHLSYESSYASWGGSIVHAENFDANTAIVIIRYDAGKKQEWINWDTMELINTAGRD